VFSLIPVIKISTFLQKEQITQKLKIVEKRETNQWAIIEFNVKE
jgi:hypothetical protein